MNYSKLLIKMFLFLAVSLLLVGCSGGDSSSGEDDTASSQYVSAAIVLPENNATVAALVDSTCEAASGFALYTGFDLNDNNILDESGMSPIN